MVLPFGLTGRANFARCAVRKHRSWCADGALAHFFAFTGSIKLLRAGRSLVFGTSGHWDDIQSPHLEKLLSSHCRQISSDPERTEAPIPAPKRNGKTSPYRSAQELAPLQSDHPHDMRALPLASMYRFLAHTEGSSKRRHPMSLRAHRPPW